MLVPQFVFFHTLTMASSFEDFNEERRTVWHCWNLTEGSGNARPNFVEERTIELKVAEMGSSSHWRIYLETMFFFQTSYVISL